MGSIQKRKIASFPGSSTPDEQDERRKTSTGSGLIPRLKLPPCWNEAPLIQDLFSPQVDLQTGARQESLSQRSGTEVGRTFTISERALRSCFCSRHLLHYQYLTVYCSILQYSTVYCSILQSILQYITIYCSILQYTAVYYSIPCKKEKLQWIILLTTAINTNKQAVPSTVKPPNKGHIGDGSFVPCREVVLFSEVFF